MIEQIDLNARWGDRKESLDDCANRASHCLQKLAECDVAFSRWFLKGRSREEALKRPFQPTFEACRELLDRGRHYRDIPRTLIEEMGFMIALWNGEDGSSAVNIRFQAGAYPAVAALPAVNECMIELPIGGPVADRLLREERLRSVLIAVVESWNPDWARVSTYQMRQAIYPQPYQGIQIGWLTYLSDRYEPIPQLPAGYRMVPIDSFGTLVEISDIDRLTAANPAHVEAVRRLAEILIPIRIVR